MICCSYCNGLTFLTNAAIEGKFIDIIRTRHVYVQTYVRTLKSDKPLTLSFNE